MLLFWLFLAEAGGDDARAGDVAAGEVDEVALLSVRSVYQMEQANRERGAENENESTLVLVDRIDVTRATPSMPKRQLPVNQEYKTLSRTHLNGSSLSVSSLYFIWLPSRHSTSLDSSPRP